MYDNQTIAHESAKQINELIEALKTSQSTIEKNRLEEDFYFRCSSFVDYAYVQDDWKKLLKQNALQWGFVLTGLNIARLLNSPLPKNIQDLRSKILRTI
jgi:hypothetical protein